MKNEELEFPWNVYAELQAQEDRITKIGHRERAGDEKLNEVLDRIADGTLTTDTEAFQKKMVNFEVNHQRKHLRRELILNAWAAKCIAEYYLPDEMFSKLEIEQTVNCIKEIVSVAEYQTLWALAFDKSYAEVAKDDGKTEGAIKASVCRLRKRLRNQISN